MMLPLTIMFAAVLMTISLLSKTSKEANSYIAPLMLLVLMPPWRLWSPVSISMPGSR